MFKKLIFVGIFLSSISSAQAAVVWNWDGLNLVGAQNINVDGTPYNVEFKDGTCIELFGGCNELSDFTFTTEAEVKAALQSLLDQVLLDINDIGQPFDSTPYLTEGCVSASPAHCDIQTPFGFGDQINGDPGVKYFLARNGGANITDFQFFDGVRGEFTGDPAYDTASTNATLGQFETWAVWSPYPVSPVPVPAALWLFGTALIGLVGFSKRRKSS